MNEHTRDELRPVPDPSTLTTAQLLREIQSLRSIVEERIAAIEQKFTTRFNGMDKALELIQAAADKVPSEVDIKVGNLDRLVAEQLKAVAQRFEERDVRTAETASLNKLAIDAALQAQKEAAGKAEEGTTRQIQKLDELIGTKTDALGTEIRANLANLDTKANANKERLDRIDGQERGVTKVTDDNSRTQGLIIAGVGLMLGIGLAIFGRGA